MRRGRASRRRVLQTFAALVFALSGTAASGEATSGSAVFVGHLELDGSLFWEGEHVDLGVNGPAELPSCGLTGTCRDYAFQVADGAARMRIAMDLYFPAVPHDPEPDKLAQLEVYDPAGAFVTSVQHASYSTEVFICFPAAPCSTERSGSGFAEFGFNYEGSSGGLWTARVVPETIHDWTYRLRAHLDASPPALPDATTVLLPNLRAAPAFELTFTAPATPFGPGLGAGGISAASCHPGDDPERPAVVLARCLRFSSGPENIGPGQLDLRGRLGPSDRTPTAFQHMLAADGTDLGIRDAGVFEFHATHGHWHYRAFLVFDLLSVSGDDPGVLVSVGQGRKVGVCPGDMRMPRWTASDQSRKFLATDGQPHTGPLGPSCLNPLAPGAALSAGWQDIYEWWRFEQYVEMPSGVDGLFVLRATVDPNGWVLEADEEDNSSYAYIRITGGAIEILERGYGTDPSDPNKTVVHEFAA